MSGPWAEGRPLYVRTAADVSLWPLRIRSGNGVAMVECAECGDGLVLTAGRPGRPFVLAELTALVGTHIATCSAGARGRS